MTVPPQQQPYAQSSPTQVVVTHPPSNTMGLAGFITSILGLISCGILSPIGLILSLIGLTRQPRGFAIAGSIIGLIGSIFMVAFGITIVLGLLGLGKAAKEISERLTTHQSARQVYLQLDQQRKQGGAAAALTAATVSNVAAQHKDAWGTPFRASLTNGEIMILSAGPDKTFDNTDDIRFDEAELQATDFSTTQPAAGAAGGAGGTGAGAGGTGAGGTGAGGTGEGGTGAGGTGAGGTGAGAGGTGEGGTGGDD